MDQLHTGKYGSLDQLHTGKCASLDQLYTQVNVVLWISVAEIPANTLIWI